MKAWRLPPSTTCHMVSLEIETVACNTNNRLCATEIPGLDEHASHEKLPEIQVLRACCETRDCQCLLARFWHGLHQTSLVRIIRPSARLPLYLTVLLPGRDVVVPMSLTFRAPKAFL